MTLASRTGPGRGSRAGHAPTDAKKIWPVTKIFVQGDDQESDVDNPLSLSVTVCGRPQQADVIDASELAIETDRPIESVRAAQRRISAM